MSHLTGWNDMFDPLTLIFIGLAVFVLLKLRSVLGTKTGEEPDRFHREPSIEKPPIGTDKVVQLPNRNPAPPVEAPLDLGPRWGKLAPEGSPLAAGFDAIAARDSSFDPTVFIAGARSAYEMIVLAFAHADRNSLKMLLSADVYEGFEAALKERESRGESVETRFIGINRADIREAQMRGTVAHIVMGFSSELVTVTRDKNGAVVDGSPDKVATVNDIWTFARDTTNRDPNWKLVATETEQ